MITNELSLIVPYTYGDELRQKAIFHCINSIKAQIYRGYELIIVEEILGSQSESKFPYPRKVDKHIILKDACRGFNKSWCINVGIKQAKYDNAVIIDADVIFGKEYLNELLKFKKNCPLFFSGYNYIILLPGRDNPVVRIKTHFSIKAMGGIWFTDRNYLFKTLGGMNENYFGYGGEDNDLYERARNILETIPAMPYPVAHQYHHWRIDPIKRQTKDLSGEYKKNLKLLRQGTSRYSEEIIDRLKNAKLGNPKCPTEIKMGCLS